MSIFKEMHELRVISSRRDFEELQRMLSEAISRGYVEQLPVMNPSRFLPLETWYRDKETGEIYSLTPPDERDGSWTAVDISELKKPDETIQ